jgi:hypothetical protein
MSSGTEISAAVFGQHIHLTFNACDFFFCGFLRDKVYNSKPWLKELKKIFLRKLQIFLQNSFKGLIRTCSLMGGMSMCEGRQHF